MKKGKMYVALAAAVVLTISGGEHLEQRIPFWIRFM